MTFLALEKYINFLSWSNRRFLTYLCILNFQASDWETIKSTLHATESQVHSTNMYWAPTLSQALGQGPELVVKQTDR